jgi:hypothetical protein
VDTSDLMRRIVKEQLVKFDGTPLFPERYAYTVNHSLSDLEARLYYEVTDYVKEEMNRADRLGKPRFAGQPPVNPKARSEFGHSSSWPKSAGLACDIRHYGQWIRDEAEKRIGHLYPKVRLSKEHSGREARVIDGCGHGR